MINTRYTKAEKESPDYYGNFVEKFKPKKTTDDCITPWNVYEAVRGWVIREYGIPGDARIVRPFWPDADYTAADYSGECVVIDNPPFSIITKIIRWYQERGIKYFLFAPTLTLFSLARGTANYVVCGVTVTYDNGANVNTSFVTNMGADKIHVSGELHEIVKRANDANRREQTTMFPKYSYPPNVTSAALLQAISTRGIELRIGPESTHWTSGLDSQRTAGKAIFGAGFLLDEKATAEKVAAERAAEKVAAEKVAAEKAAEKAAAWEWPLSERETRLIKSMGGD